ncbi:MAG TPA: SUMF1/EgtB/PvdO family nonheme iron enzyme, partial [Spirochaetia bacterium]|nr:SUMF1/EgtB/PvdO family nonheme iron enzyme [Spirochaetia bacterium]
MREDKRITAADIEGAEVRLGPVLGLEPGKWLAALLGLGLLLVLFLVLVLPGLVRNGSLVAFDSLPRGAAVRVDGVYVGSTPCEAFVASGPRSVQVARPFFAPYEEKVEVKGRVLASLVAPRRVRIEPSLAPLDPKGLLSSSYAEYAAWALTGKPTAAFQLPLVLSDALLSLAEAGASSALPRAEAPLLAARALAAAPGPEAARDALRASFLAAAGGAPSPLGLVAGLEALAAAEGSNPSLARYLEAILPEAARTRLSAMDGYEALAAKAPAPKLATADDSAASARAGASLSVRGVLFRAVPAGSFTMRGSLPDGGLVPYAAAVPPSYLAAAETSRADWARFLADNPEWAPANRAALVARGDADGDYLADWDSPGLPGSLPVTHVSWPAVKAYCDWLSRRAPAGLKAVLPSEELWERAASLGGAFSAPAKGAVLFASARKGPEPSG